MDEAVVQVRLESTIDSISFQFDWENHISCREQDNPEKNRKTNSM